MQTDRWHVLTAARLSRCPVSRDRRPGRPGAELLWEGPGGKVLGHRPAEGDERVRPFGVDRAEQLGESRPDSAGDVYGRVVEQAAAGSPSPRTDEDTVVELTLVAEPLRQATAPGALLAGRACVPGAARRR